MTKKRNQAIAKKATVKVPFAKSSTSVRKPANIRVGRSGDGRITVTHKEWLQKIAPLHESIYEVVMDRYINPGLPGTFPWLSSIANNYESYSVTQMRFNYIPRCAATTPGTVMMLVDYDALDDAPSSEQRFMNSHRATSGPAWAPQTLFCDVKDLNKLPQRYTRKGEHIVQDLKTYDLGRVFIAIEGANAENAPFGAVEIEYTIVLMTPQLRDLLPEESFFLSNDDVTTVAPVGNPETAVIRGGLPVSVANPTTLLFKDAGEYLLNSTWNGTDITVPPLPSIADQLGVIDNFITTINAAGTVARLGSKLKILQPGAEVPFAAATATTLSGFGMRASPYSYNV